MREALVEQAENFIRTTSLERGGLRPILGEGLLTTDGAAWRWQRRTASPVFRHDRLLGFVPAMQAAARRNVAAPARGPGRRGSGTGARNDAHHLRYHPGNHAGRRRRHGCRDRGSGGQRSARQCRLARRAGNVARAGLDAVPGSRPRAGGAQSVAPHGGRRRRPRRRT
ncbi:MAG: hypothetical protein WDN04_18935 [Rhodospirillales bacterium]